MTRPGETTWLCAGPPQADDRHVYAPRPEAPYTGPMAKEIAEAIERARDAFLRRPVESLDLHLAAVRLRSTLLPGSVVAHERAAAAADVEICRLKLAAALQPKKGSRR